MSSAVSGNTSLAGAPDMRSTVSGNRNPGATESPVSAWAPFGVANPGDWRGNLDDDIWVLGWQLSPQLEC